MNTFCRPFSNNCKINIISISRYNNASVKLLPRSHDKNLDTSALTNSWKNTVVLRSYSTAQLHLQKGLCNGYSGKRSHQLQQIRWKSFGGYSNFGHRDNEKTPLFTKIYYSIPTIGMFCLFVDWPLVFEYAINKAKGRGYDVPTPIIHFVEIASAGGQDPDTEEKRGSDSYPYAIKNETFRSKVV